MKSNKSSSLAFAFLFLFVTLFAFSSTFVQAQSSNLDNRNSDIFTPAVVLASSGAPGTVPPGTIYDYRWFAFQTCPFFFNQPATNTFFGAPNPFGTFGNPLFFVVQSDNTIRDLPQLISGSPTVQFNLPTTPGFSQIIFNFKSTITTNAPVAQGTLVPTNNVCPVATRDGATSLFVFGPPPQSYLVEANVFEDAAILAQSASTGSTVLTPIGPGSTARQARIYEVLFDAATVQGFISPTTPSGFVTSNPFSQTVSFNQFTKLCINIVAFICVPDLGGLTPNSTDALNETTRQCSNAFAQVTGSNVGFSAEQCPIGTFNPFNPFTTPF